MLRSAGVGLFAGLVTTQLLGLPDGVGFAVFIVLTLRRVVAQAGAFMCRYCGKDIKVGSRHCHHCGRENVSWLMRRLRVRELAARADEQRAEGNR